MTVSERAQAIAYGTRTVLQVEQEILYGKIVVAIQDAVAEEREACAQLALTVNDCCECGDDGCHVGDLCPTAEAIRARA